MYIVSSIHENGIKLGEVMLRYNLIQHHFPHEFGSSIKGRFIPQGILPSSLVSRGMKYIYEQQVVISRTFVSVLPEQKPS